MSLKDFLLELARTILQQVIDAIAQQVRTMQNDIIEEITSFILGPIDEYWTGDSAEQFAGEVRDMVSILDETCQTISSTCSGLESARDRIIAADQQALGLVQELESEFQRIVQ